MFGPTNGRPEEEGCSVGHGGKEGEWAGETRVPKCFYPSELYKVSRSVT